LGMERLYRGDIDQTSIDGLVAKGWTPDQGEVLRKNDHASFVIEELAGLVRQPIIAVCAALLSGASEIRLWHDQLLYKPSERTAIATSIANVGWHTDRQYWLTCSSEEMLTAWVPFHAVGELEGAISFIDSSHLWDTDVALNFFDPDLSTLEQLRERHDVTVRNAAVPRGAATFHHCRTIHGSGPNKSEVARRSIAIHMQPGDNHYIPHTGPDGQPSRHRNDDLVRRTPDGNPDYADPVVCPRLWPLEH
jgi:ectoine hydroxylase-related dioxygenase (phytanoyl-CoA dioxygenase family)